MAIQATVFAATDGDKTTLQILTIEGQRFEFEVIDPAALLEGLKRAVKAQEDQWIKDAPYRKPQPKGVREGRFDI